MSSHLTADISCTTFRPWGAPGPVTPISNPGRASAADCQRKSPDSDAENRDTTLSSLGQKAISTSAGETHALVTGSLATRRLLAPISANAQPSTRLSEADCQKMDIAELASYLCDHLTIGGDHQRKSNKEIIVQELLAPLKSAPDEMRDAAEQICKQGLFKILKWMEQRQAADKASGVNVVSRISPAYIAEMDFYYFATQVHYNLRAEYTANINAKLLQVLTGKDDNPDATSGAFDEYLVKLRPLSYAFEVFQYIQKLSEMPHDDPYRSIMKIRSYKETVDHTFFSAQAGLIEKQNKDNIALSEFLNISPELTGHLESLYSQFISHELSDAPDLQKAALSFCKLVYDKIRTNVARRLYAYTQKIMAAGAKIGGIENLEKFYFYAYATMSWQDIISKKMEDCITEIKQAIVDGIEYKRIIAMRYRFNKNNVLLALKGVFDNFNTTNNIYQTENHFQHDPEAKAVFNECNLLDKRLIEIEHDFTKQKLDILSLKLEQLSSNRQRAWACAADILARVDTLNLHDDHPLFLKALEVMTVATMDDTHPNNPYKLHKNLLASLADERKNGLLSTVTTPFAKITGKREDGSIVFDLHKFRTAMQQAAYTVADLSAEFDANSFEKQFYALEQRLKKLHDEGKGTLLAHLEAAIQHISLSNLTDLKSSVANSLIPSLLAARQTPAGKPIDPTAFRLDVWLQALHSLSDVPENEGALSKRERKFLTLCSSMRVCPVGQRDAIHLAYSNLDENLRHRKQTPVAALSMAEEAKLDGESPAAPARRLTGAEKILRCLNTAVPSLASLVDELLMHEEVLQELAGGSFSQTSHQTQFIRNRYQQQLALKDKPKFDLHTEALPVGLITTPPKEALAVILTHIAKAMVERLKPALAEAMNSQIKSEAITQQHLVEYFEDLFPQDQIENDEWVKKYMAYDANDSFQGLTDLGWLALTGFVQVTSSKATRAEESKN